MLDVTNFATVAMVFEHDSILEFDYSKLEFLSNAIMPYINEKYTP